MSGEEGVEPRRPNRVRPRLVVALVIAALLVGLVETLGRSAMPDLLRLFLDPSSARSAGAALASMLVYVVMALILALRPAGLFPVRR